MRSAFLGVSLLAGCSSHQGGDAFATFVGLTVATLSAYEASPGGVDYLEGTSRRAPEMAPDRKVSEQDCTKPLDYSLGNIRCQ
jgi:hypothetical protein